MGDATVLNQRRTDECDGKCNIRADYCEENIANNECIFTSNGPPLELVSPINFCETNFLPIERLCLLRTCRQIVSL